MLRRGIASLPSLAILKADRFRTNEFCMTPKICFFVLLIAGIAASAASRAQSAKGSASPIVVLPQYTVTDTPILPDRETWRYLSIPGYEIIAQTSDTATALLAKDILEFGEIIQKVCPATVNTRLEPSRLILCTQRATFESFIPSSVRAELPLEQVTRLFLGDDTHPVIVLYFDAKTGGDGYDVELARAYVANRLHTQFPPLPGWYIEGISRLYAAAEITPRGKQLVVVVGRLDARPPPRLPPTDASGLSSEDFTPQASGKVLTTDVARVVQGDILGGVVRQASALGATTPVDPDEHLVGFRKYFIDNSKHVPPLAALFAGPTATNFEDWSQGCGFFLHYCLFSSEKRTLFPAMQKFFKTMPTAADADPAAAFQAAFKRSYREIESNMGFYVVENHYQATKYLFPNDPPSLPPVREATDAEMSDIKAGAYLAAGYKGQAYAELIAAYKREKTSGDIEPRLLAALGVWEAAHGQPGRAAPLLAAAAATRYPEPEMYVAIARQRLEQIGSGRPLTADETLNCLEPLASARAMEKPDPGIYYLGAEILTRTSVGPPATDSAILAEGIRNFPGDSTLNYDAALAYLHLGQAKYAKVIIERELAYGDSATRASFGKLLAGEPSGGSSAALKMPSSESR